MQVSQVIAPWQSIIYSVIPTSNQQPSLVHQTNSPLLKSSKAWVISAAVFMTNGPCPTTGSRIGSPLSNNMVALVWLAMSKRSPSAVNCTNWPALATVSLLNNTVPSKTKAKVFHCSGKSTLSSEWAFKCTSHTFIGVCVCAGPIASANVPAITLSTPA